MDKVSVFIVDDDPVVREGLRTFLELQPDLEFVGEAADGVEALEKVGQLLPDVVLLWESGQFLWRVEMAPVEPEP